MSCIIQRGLGISQGILLVARKTLSPTQTLTARCPVKLKPYQGGLPVRMISISSASKRSVAPVGLFLLVSYIKVFVLCWLNICVYVKSCFHFLKQGFINVVRLSCYFSLLYGICLSLISTCMILKHFTQLFNLVFNDRPLGPVLCLGKHITPTYCSGNFSLMGLS